jgi:redox-sensitive bicupin YhaK (pirin superfamily)
MKTETINILKRPAAERGQSDFGWLDSRHSFSFGAYMDPEYVGFRSLRVINEDKVAAGKGFGTHPHQSMEILSYVVDGELEHKDSMGNGRIIKAGEFQYMSAGSGVLHSEFNPSKTNPAHFLQIWIQPREQGGEPRYRDFDTAEKRVKDGLFLLASPDGEGDSAEIRQDAQIHFGDLSAGKTLTVAADATYPYAWIQLIKGTVSIGDTELGSGDGAAIEASSFDIRGSEDAEFLLFRLS